MAFQHLLGAIQTIVAGYEKRLTILNQQVLHTHFKEVRDFEKRFQRGLGFVGTPPRNGYVTLSESVRQFHGSYFLFGQDGFDSVEFLLFQSLRIQSGR